MKTSVKKWLSGLFRKTHNKSLASDLLNITGQSPEKANQILQQIPLQNTPFTAVKFEDKWFLAMGKYRLTEPLKTYNEVAKAAKDATWDRIMQIMQIVISEHEEKKKLDTTIEKQKQNGSAKPITINN